MTAIVHARRLAPPRLFDHRHVNQTIEELNVILRELQQQVAESRGLSGPESVSLGRHLDMGGKRLQGVGPTRAETDVPNVSELRKHALYARDGHHETDKLIIARGGIRTVTPAVAPNDLITLGQAQALVRGTGVSQQGNGVAANGHWNYPQAAVTLANGLTSNYLLPNSTYIRISGPTAAFALGGFQTIADGRLLILHNATSQDLTLVNEDLATPATHRIQTGIGSDLTMSGVGLTQFLYSVADARWVVL